jgi:uncharacterized protein YjgD (DUF1641 family)
MTDKQLEELLKSAADQLGTTTDQLKQMVQSGTLEKRLNESVSAPAEQLRQVLNDPQTAQKLLSSPQAQEILRMLQKRNGGR